MWWLSCRNKEGGRGVPGAFRPYPPPGRGQRGFTLIEVMTALVILALMATITFSVVLGTSRRSKDLRAEMELRQTALMIINLMAEDLKGAFVHETNAYFQGFDNYHRDLPTDGMNLVTTSTLPVNPKIVSSDLAEVGYTLSFEDDSTTGILTRREQVPPETPEGEGGVAYELSARVRSLNLRYFDGEDWLDEWDSQDMNREHMFEKLPREIEMELTLSEAGKKEITLRTRVAPPMAEGT